MPISGRPFSTCERSAAGPSFGVLIGPLSIQEIPLMQTMLGAVGVAQQWPLPVCTIAHCAAVCRGPGVR